MNTLVAIWLIVSAVLFPVSREKFISEVVKEVEKESSVIILTSCPFTDVSSDSDACKGFHVGITAGTSETTFEPNRNILQYEAFLMLGKADQYLSNRR